MNGAMASGDHSVMCIGSIYENDHGSLSASGTGIGYTYIDANNSANNKSWSIPASLSNDCYFITSNHTGSETYSITNMSSILNSNSPHSIAAIFNHDSSEANKGRSSYRSIETRDNTGVRMNSIEIYLNDIVFRSFSEDGTERFVKYLMPMIYTTASTNTFQSLLNNTLGQTADYLVTTKLPSMSDNSVEQFYHLSYGRAYCVTFFRYRDTYYSMFFFSYDGQMVLCYRDGDVKCAYSLTGFYPGSTPKAT